MSEKCNNGDSGCIILLLIAIVFILLSMTQKPVTMTPATVPTATTETPP